MCCQSRTGLRGFCDRWCRRRNDATSYYCGIIHSLGPHSLSAWSGSAVVHDHHPPPRSLTRQRPSFPLSSFLSPLSSPLLSSPSFRSSRVHPSALGQRAPTRQRGSRHVRDDGLALGVVMVGVGLPGCGLAGGRGDSSRRHQLGVDQVSGKHDSIRNDVVLLRQPDGQHARQPPAAILLVGVRSHVWTHGRLLVLCVIPIRRHLVVALTGRTNDSHGGRHLRR